MIDFFNQLKRRKVYQTSAAYAAIAFVIMQVVEIIFPMFEIPVWVGRFIVIALIIGFPITIILSWMYERTSSGVVREKDAPILDSSKLFIAVLPFADLSPNKDKTYFCEGVSEELINQLSQVKGLQLVSRTSSFKFKKEDSDIKKIGNLLNVKLIVEGSIQFSNNDVRISARLTSVDSGFQIWTERYDRKLDNIFDIQDEIASSISLALELEILGKDNKSIKRHSENVNAYKDYLKGRFSWNNRNKENLQEGIIHFTNAINKDEKYSLAYSGLADSYSVQGWYNYNKPNIAYSKAKKHALKSIENSSVFSEGYISLAYINHHYDWDWEQADFNFNKGIKLNPDYSVGHHWYSIFLSSRLNFTKAQIHISKAKELDPLSMVIKTADGWINYMNQNYNKVIDILEEEIHNDSSLPWAYYVLAQAYEENKEYALALKNYKYACELGNDSPFYLAGLGHMEALAGNTDNALKILEKLKALKEKSFISSLDLALAGMGIHEKDETLGLINFGIEERVSHVPYLMVDPRFSNYVDDELINIIENRKM
jgi:adenylate cyclase